MLERRLDLTDFTLIAIGSVIGSGIFGSPAVVAQRAHAAPLIIMLCWAAGGALALIIGLVFAELSSRRPQDGGLYAYLRDAYGPGTGFVFVWMVFWLFMSGATAASAALFGVYFERALHLSGDPRIIAVIAVIAVSTINAFGVRQGAGWQNILVTLKICAIGALIVAGFVAAPLTHSAAVAQLMPLNGTAAILGAVGMAMLPVLFACNGVQSATYVTGEVREPARVIPRGLVIGMAIVVAVYILVNAGCLRVLGEDGLAATTTPGADVMRAAFGSAGSAIIAAAIALSTLGYMSTAILAGPRAYFQLARDGMMFSAVAWVHPRTRVPLVAIVLQGAVAAVIAASGTFAQIVSWITLPNWVFLAMAAFSIFIFRKRDGNRPKPAVRVPGHPWTTATLILAVTYVVVAQLVTAPADAMFGIGAAILGALVYRLIVRPRVSKSAFSQTSLASGESPV